MSVIEKYREALLQEIKLVGDMAPPGDFPANLFVDGEKHTCPVGDLELYIEFYKSVSIPNRIADIDYKSIKRDICLNTILY